MERHIFQDNELNPNAVWTEALSPTDWLCKCLELRGDGKKPPGRGHMMREGDPLQAETWELRSLLNIM